ncbi:ATP-binding protein [Streptomyces luteolus]|uniref:ATP-binding protein n=1 Tax=Streptomyces luteolus TaxID=3043615 RepID=A0ABT6SYD7_9ACTN|nr:ATP-binding protein [Streptomyces sp. B-S-A12]MDI3420128.1 ATP-binding protein [Streptomyces sp. B-S-A12]
MNHRVTPQLTSVSRQFSQLLSATPRGARLARRLAGTELTAWGAPPDLTERAELVVAELAANAVVHGRVPGRDFRLALAYDPASVRLRIEVTDARGDRLPDVQPIGTAPRTSGHGLLLVAALCDHWETVPYPPSGKTVVAQLTAEAVSASGVLPGGAASARPASRGPGAGGLA